MHSFSPVNSLVASSQIKRMLFLKGFHAAKHKKLLKATHSALSVHVYIYSSVICSFLFGFIFLNTSFVFLL